jgi:alpha-tubulin suppressor-like RCC1 family protein
LVDGYIYATGNNTAGQLGIGNGKNYFLEPQKIPQLNNVSIIHAAKFSACIADG